MDDVNGTRGAEPNRGGTGSARHARRIRLEGIQFRTEIGRGRGTVVYRALRQSDHTEIVVKVLMPVDGLVSPRCDGFIQAGRRQMVINHPNLLACFDADSSSDFGYQILEMAQGQDLARMLTTVGPVAYKQALSLIVSAARGIEAMAKDNLVHGAIALHNLYVAQPGEAMVAVPSGPLPARVDATSQLALHRTTLGCVPPEVLLGESTCTPRGDIYSLGAALRALITADQTRRVATWQEFEAIMSGATTGGEDEVPGLPPEVNAVLRKALAIDPAQRYARVSHLREDLERVQHDFSPIHARSQPTLAMQRRRSWSATATETAPYHQEDLTVELPEAHGGSVAGDSDGGDAVATSPSDGAAAPRPHRAPASAILRDGPRPAGPQPMLLVAVAALVVVLLGLLVVLLLDNHHHREQDRGPAPATAPQAPSPLADAPVPAAAGVALSAAPAPATQPSTPAWAAASGSDEAGRWADLVIRGETQRFRSCPPGSFWMGSPVDEDGRRDDEKRTLVTLSHGFWMADSEVTQQFFTVVMGDNPSAFRGPQLPVDSLTYERCMEFIAKLTQLSGAPARLPSEAEWEYACRAGSDSAYAVPPEDGGWTRETSATTTHPVKGLRPNRWGLYDMEGNVLEWCQDTFGDYPAEAVTDPVATGGIFQVARGGAWSMPASECRSAARHHYESVAHLFFIGARLLIEDGPSAGGNGRTR